MAYSMYVASIPVFQQSLGSLSAILDKAQAHCEAKKIDPAALTKFRLYPDMLPFFRQIHLACDFAKNTGARLAGVEIPKFEDVEETFDELKARIAKTRDYLATLPHTAIDEAAAREIAMTIGGNELRFVGANYLAHFALPNFFFHVTTAYNILRHNGVDIGKWDFIGKV